MLWRLSQACITINNTTNICTPCTSVLSCQYQSCHYFRPQKLLRYSIDCVRRDDLIGCASPIRPARSNQMLAHGQPAYCFFHQSRLVASSFSNCSFNHLSLSSISSYFTPGSALGFTHLSATFQLLSRLYAHHFSVVSPFHVISRSCASCPPALQRYFSSSLKSFAWLWSATTFASSLAITQVARQLPISICRSLGVFGIVTTPPGSNWLLSSVSAFGILLMWYTISSIQ